MSNTVKLAGKLPGGIEVNGIDQTAKDLIDDPKQLRCAVVWYDVQKITDDIEHSTEVPTIQVRRFEPLGSADVVSKTIKAEVEKVIKARTGRTPIPWDIVEVVEGHDPDQMTIGDDE